MYSKTCLKSEITNFNVFPFIFHKWFSTINNQVSSESIYHIVIIFFACGFLQLEEQKKKFFSIRCEKDSQFLPFWFEHWCCKSNFSTQFENIPIKNKQKIKIICSNRFYNHRRVCIVIIILLSLLLLLSEM